MVNALFTALALIAAGQAQPAAGERASTRNVRSDHAASLPARRSGAARAKGLARLRDLDEGSRG
jgi:hypothetical protein